MSSAGSTCGELARRRQVRSARSAASFGINHRPLLDRPRRAFIEPIFESKSAIEGPKNAVFSQLKVPFWRLFGDFSD